MCTLLILSISCIKAQKKINGISFVASRSEISTQDIADVKSFNANYIAVIPYGFMRNLNSPDIKYNSERQWWGEQHKGVISTIDQFHKNGIEIMLKPQIWISRGQYTGHIQLENEEQWKQLETSYRNFILDYAQIAEDRKIALFCIATEMDSFIQERPEFWQKLVEEIRAVYSGRLTYAGNWDSYKRAGFWDQLDYIGVDAYFPVSDKKTPDLESISAGWKRWKLEMSSLSRKLNKPILLTEYGYISADYAGKEPWKSAEAHQEVNEKAQKMLLQGLYDNLWQEEWLAGGFLWKHFPEQFYQGDRRRGFEKLFNVQEKEAAEVVKEVYGGKF